MADLEDQTYENSTDDSDDVRADLHASPWREAASAEDAYKDISLQVAALLREPR